MSKKANKKLNANKKTSAGESTASSIMTNKMKNSKESGKKSASAKAGSNKKTNVFKSVVKFFKDSINEIKKIVWPTPKATFNNMLVVLVVVCIVGLFVFALDAGLLAVLSKFMGIAGS